MVGDYDDDATENEEGKHKVKEKDETEQDVETTEGEQADKVTEERKT